MSYNTDTTRYEDFVGFTFADTHSSDLNLFRVNDGGDRYTWDLVPTFQDKTVQVGGRDGTYLFGSDYQRKEITINVAFDNVGEEDFRKIQSWGADKKVHKLIFDEWPYKYYNVKLTSPPQLKFICFDESENYSEEAYKGNTTRRRRIYKGEGTFKFTCYESFARGCILSQRDMYQQEPENIKVYISKDVTEPIEIPVSALKGIDTASLYLSSDIYDRDEWGMAYQNEDGVYWRGQYNPDPNLGKDESRISTSYYAYQPQRVDLKTLAGENTVQLASNYQTYLYPIDLKHGFIGTVDRNGVTNGNLIDQDIHTETSTDWDPDISSTYNDMLLDNPFNQYHQQDKRTEIVQYHPKLKVTYGKASGAYEIEERKRTKIRDKQDEYGVYKILEYDETNGSHQATVKIKDGKPQISKIKSINKSVAAWENGNLDLIRPFNEKEIYDCIFEDENELTGSFFDISDWDDKEMYNKLYVVKCATNTIISDDEHSIYMLPNSKVGQFRMKCKYKDLLDNSHTITFDIELVDSDSPKLKNDNGELEDHISIEYYANTTHSYNEWAPYLGLPETAPKWENGQLILTNPGDIDMPFIVDYEKQDGSTLNETLVLGDKKLSFELTILDEDDGIFVDSDLRIIRGYKLDEQHRKIPKDTIYNRYITEGDFFYIPCGISTLTSNYTPELIYEYRYL